MKLFSRTLIIISLGLSMSAVGLSSVECSEEKIKNEVTSLFKNGFKNGGDDKAINYIQDTFATCEDKLSDEAIQALDTLEMSVEVETNLPTFEQRLKAQNEAIETAKKVEDIDPAIIDELNALKREYATVDKKYIDADRITDPYKSGWTNFNVNREAVLVKAKKKIASFNFDQGKSEGFRGGVEKVQKRLESLLAPYLSTTTTTELTDLSLAFSNELEAKNSKARAKLHLGGQELMNAKDTGKLAFRVVLKTFLNDKVLAPVESISKTNEV